MQVDEIAKKVRMTLEGENDKAFVLLASFRSHARRQGWAADEIEAVLEKAQADDYAYLVRTLRDHVEDPNEDNDASDG